MIAEGKVLMIHSSVEANKPSCLVSNCMLLKYIILWPQEYGTVSRALTFDLFIA